MKRILFSLLLVWAAVCPVGAHRVLSLDSCQAMALQGNRQLASTTSVKGFAINWDGETDGLSAVDNGQSAKGETIYTLSGQRVSKPTRGLYIVNGKKVVIK